MTRPAPAGRYQYIDYEQNIYRQDLETLFVEYWDANGRAWREVFDSSKITTFGHDISAAQARKLK